MKVLFVSISALSNMNGHGITVDLLREFQRNGHDVYVMCAIEKNHAGQTSLKDESGFHVLRVKIGNNKKANPIVKGITTLRLPDIYIEAAKTYLADVKFDLIMYPTPPVTHYRTVKYLKKRDDARTYLLLKDIFPQNAVDIGMMTKKGPKGILYRYFRGIEEKLYAISDHIGCMSRANVDYVLKHNLKVRPEIVEVSPNSIEVEDKSISREAREQIRAKYGIPLDKRVYIYGGNLGKPQGIPFLIQCLKNQRENKDVLFLIVGDGTEYKKLETYIQQDQPANVKLMKRLPKEDYDVLVAACDVGMIFLDHRFTIPNFPSRSLSYMQARQPILAVTDPNTDIGKVIVDGGFGWWCESNDTNAFAEAMRASQAADLKAMGDKGFDYLQEHYTVAQQYQIIMKHFQ